MKQASTCLFAAFLLPLTPIPALAQNHNIGLWGIYNNFLKHAKHIDLTHAFSPTTAVWRNFENAKFKPSVAPVDSPGYIKKGQAFTYNEHGLVSTTYELPTDHYGTQLDPPAHRDQYGATISDLPATYAVRPLVVIDIHDEVAADPGYHCDVEDIKAWEAKHGKVPEGSVVMIRSDWHKKWGDVENFNKDPFPGISISALRFLHLERRILFHGHEPLQTDTTPMLQGENWLLHNQYSQAEGVANLDLVAEAGCLISIGFAKPAGGTGGFARYVAICPPGWTFGKSVAEVSGAPLPRQPYPLRRDENGVLRPTK
jgi:kynurenine formamidase